METRPPLDQKTEVVSSVLYPVGKTELPLLDVPMDTKETVFSVSREGWPDLGPQTPVVEIRQYFSFDNGATWHFGGSSEHVGGEYRHRDGYVMPEISLKLSGLPDSKNASRKMRLEIHPVQPITGKVSVEMKSRETIPDPVIETKG